MGLGGFLGSSSLEAISPGSLLGSTLVLAALWAMRPVDETTSRSSGSSRRLLPSASPPSCVALEPSLGLTSPLRDESGSDFDEWVLLMTTRFRGKPWLLQMPGQTDILVVSDPETLEDIQRTYVGLFAKLDDWEGNLLARDVHGGMMAGTNVIGNPRASSKTQRKWVAEALKVPALHVALSKLVEKHCGALQTILEKDADCTGARSVDMTALMRTFAMEVFAELGLGAQLGGLNGLKAGPSAFEQAVDDIQTRLTQRSKRSTVLWSLEKLLNLGDEAALSHSLSVVDDTVSTVLMDKRGLRGSGSGRPDIISLLLGAESSGKSTRDPALLTELVLGLVLAARESTAHALSMCMYCLAQRPEEQTKIQQALDREEKSAGSPALVYIEAALKETLRLFPPKTFVRRRALQGVVLSDGTFVAAGTHVAMAVYSTARREEVWGLDAAKFRPERWIDAKTGKLRPASHYKFNAFLAGPRACPGAGMALTEMKTVLMALLSKFRVEPVQKQTSSGLTSSTGGATCRLPPGGAHVKVQLRRRSLVRTHDLPGEYS